MSVHRSSWWLLIALVASAFGCASTPPAPPSDPDFIDGVRQRPLTAEEVGQKVGYSRAQLAGCYQRFRLSFGLTPPSDYRVRLRIPTDGTGHVAEIVEATQAGQEELERCLVEVLERVPFPAHVGEPLVVDVPIRAPQR